MREFSGRTELWKAAGKRRADAHRLAASGAQHGAGAVYLAGYSLECKLKAMLMEIHGVLNLGQLASAMKLDESSVYSHDLEFLLHLLPGWRTIRGSMVWNDFAKVVAPWRPSWRYRGEDLPLSFTRRFLEAVDRILLLLDTMRP